MDHTVTKTPKKIYHGDTENTESTENGK